LFGRGVSERGGEEEKREIRVPLQGQGEKEMIVRRDRHHGRPNVILPKGKRGKKWAATAQPKGERKPGFSTEGGSCNPAIAGGEGGGEKRSILSPKRGMEGGGRIKVASSFRVEEEGEEGKEAQARPVKRSPIR